MIRQTSITLHTAVPDTTRLRCCLDSRSQHSGTCCRLLGSRWNNQLLGLHVSSHKQQQRATKRARTALVNNVSLRVARCALQPSSSWNCCCCCCCFVHQSTTIVAGVFFHQPSTPPLLSSASHHTHLACCQCSSTSSSMSNSRSKAPTCLSLLLPPLASNPAPSPGSLVLCVQRTWCCVVCRASHRSE